MPFYECPQCGRVIAYSKFDPKPKCACEKPSGKCQEKPEEQPALEEGAALGKGGKRIETITKLEKHFRGDGVQAKKSS